MATGQSDHGSLWPLVKMTTVQMTTGQTTTGQTEAHLGGAVEQGPVGHVRVARDPAAVGRAEVHVPRPVVKRVPNAVKFD